MKAIIYYRKSTDREDKQANSLEHQLKNCKETAKINSFEVIKEIGESRSAKTEGTRPGFNELISICKKGGIDYIIIDEPKRLSRNNLDSAKVIDLFDKKKIKGIHATGRVYQTNQINDIFLLQLDLSLSKMDNAHRSKDVREKMETCVKNQKRFLGKAPFGYKNVTIKKKKSIIIVQKEAEIIKEIFKLRAEQKAYTTIGEILKKKYGKRKGLILAPNRLQKLICKKFYYGVFEWKGLEYKGSHQAIINKSLYDKANGIGKGTHIKSQTENKNIRKYPLKGFVSDFSGMKLTAYIGKGKSGKGEYKYYGNQYRSNEKVCINQEQLFNLIGEYIKEQESVNEYLIEYDKNFILNELEKNDKEINTGYIEIEKQIKDLRVRQDKLLDLRLDEKISEETYIFKSNQIEEEIQDLQEQKNNIKKGDELEKTKILLELAGSLYQCYLLVNEDGKAEIVKKLMLELKVSNKKTLEIEKSPLLESVKFLKNSNGTPNENRTRV